MRPGALTQAARNAIWRHGGAGARTADRDRRAQRTAPDAPRERRVASPSRPPRRVSGPLKGKAYATRAQAASGPTRSQTGARANGRQSAARASRPAGAARGALASRPAGAARGMFASGSAAVAAAVALPLRRPFIAREPAPKPVPVPRPARDRRRAQGARPATAAAAGLGAFLASLPDRVLLDRVVRGRAWIPLLGVLLAGIVAAQVEILKLGASMGRSLEQTTTLTSQNELLRSSVAALSDDQRIERLATGMGMVLPPPGAVGYLTAGPDGDVSGALANIHAPDASAFMALAPTNGALVTGAGTSMLPTSSGVLAQAGTPGSATPTSTPSATSTVTPSGTTASSGATTGTSGTTAATGTTQAPPAEQPPPVTTTTTTSAGSQGATTGVQPTTTNSQTPATGAAAIQPGPTQQSSGG